MQLYPSSALRIVDHHLHASGIIERSGHGGSKRFYEHDWFCVSQSVSCFPVDDLLVKSLDEEGSHSFIFVLGVGTSSIHFGNVITIDDQVLATTRRVFARKDSVSGKSLPFTEEERSRLLEYQPPDIVSIGQYSLPMLERFGSFLPKTKIQEPILKVLVGPQHINFGNHADHAFLAETAIHAMTLAGKEVSSVAINYISEASLGHTLECLVHDDTVFIVRTLRSKKRVLVLVARTKKLDIQI